MKATGGAPGAGGTLGAAGVGAGGAGGTDAPHSGGMSGTVGTGGSGAGAGGASAAATGGTAAPHSGGMSGTGGSGLGVAGSGGTSAGGAKGGGGSTGGATATGGAPSVQVCNGTCGNTGCENYTCIAAAPSGWIGPFQLFDGPPAQAPMCAAPTTNVVFTGNRSPNQTPASCGACQCGTPSGLSCSLPGSYAYSGAACGNAVQGSAGFDTRAPCVGTGFGKAQSVWNGDPNVIGTPHFNASWTCKASGGTPSLGPITWAAVGIGCAQPFPKVSGCASTETCAPIPSSPYQSRLCISSSGDIACPAATYVKKTLYYTGATDGRTCTACACSSAATVSCSGTVAFYDDPNCATSPVFTSSTFVSDFTCHAVTFTNSSLIDVSYSGTPSCGVPSTAGQPSGSIVPTNPVTVCCTP